MSTLPRYKFDPVTQRYTLLTPQEQQQEQQQDMRRGSDIGGNGSMASSPTSVASMSPETAVGFQNFGLGMKGIPSLAAQVVGAIATAVPNAFGYGTVSPVANPSPISVTSIEPTQTLASMNASAAGEDDGTPEGSVSIGAIGTEGFGEEGGATSAADAGFGVAGLASANAAAADAAADADADAAADAAAAAVGAAADAAADAGADAGAAGADGGADGGAGGDGGGGGGGDGGGGDGDGGAGDGGGGGGEGEREGGLISIKKYVNGGMAMAPQNYGRMGDSMLVHMSPREVAGLQSLARSQGTSLTVNPQTGYPEAFNLRALLPMAAGFALGPGGLLGSNALTAAQAGMLVGGATALGTGSLQKGLMAGLGAYGGAGMGEGLVTTQTPAAAGMEGAIGSGLPTPPTPTDPNLIGNPYSMAPPTGSMSQGLNAANFASTPGTGLEGFNPSLAGTTTGAGMTVPPVDVGTAKTVGLSTTPTSSKFIGNLSGKDAFKYGTAALASIPPPEYEPPQSTAMLRPYDYSFNPVTGAYDPRPGDSSEILYGRPTFTPGEVVPARAGGMMNSYAAGGLAAFKAGGRPKSRPLTDDKGLAGLPYYEFMGERGSNLEAAEKNFAAGGRTPSNGKFLMGDGDGMSDNIPATIADKQPARLADGEFVIPADVVSHIGNGSSKAGAKKLYKMMADIRKDRTGKTKQAPAIKPERHMPA